MKTSMKIVMGLMAILAIALSFAALNLAPAEGVLGMLIAAPIVLASIETSADAKQRRADIWDSMEAMVAKRKEEKRSFTEDETKKYDQLRADFDSLTEHIKTLEADEKRALLMAGAAMRNRDNEKVEKELRKYSFARAIRMRAEGKQLDGLEGEMHQEAETEMQRSTGKSVEGFGIPDMLFRTFNGGSVSGGTAGEKGGMLVETEVSGLMHSLRPMMVLAGLGANTLGGLQGNINFPKGSLATAGWKTEVATADEYQPTISVVEFKPKRLPAWAAYSKQLLIQSSPDVETFIRMELLKAIAQAVEAGAITGNGTNMPTGILSTTGIGSVVGGTAGAAPTWAHIVQLESEVEIDNALVGSLAYLTNAKMRSILKRTLKASGVSGYIWESGVETNPLNSYRTGVTNIVPSNGEKGGASNLSSIIFGDFSKLLMGQWGGLDVIVDPYSGKKTGTIEVAVNSYWDSVVLEPMSFAAMVDAITT